MRLHCVLLSIMKRENGEGKTTETRQYPEPDGTTRLGDDEFYRALADQTRRRLTYYLTEQSKTTIEDITTTLVGWEVMGEGSMASPSDHKEIRTALEHVHLPMLADGGLIEYDRDSGIVAGEDLHENVEWLLERSIEIEPD